MKSGLTKSLTALFLFFWLNAPTANAWDATGHELVSRIAWDRMTPDARMAAINILKAAPADSGLAQLFERTTGPAAERDRAFFMLASTWPDIVRGFPNRPPQNLKSKYHRSDWHYINHFWEQSEPTSPAIRKPEIQLAGQLVTKLQEFQTSLADSANPEQRALDLAWTLHLAGDVHQPLHNSARITSLPEEEDGDRGGNAFKLNPSGSNNLHTYWDKTFRREFSPRENPTLDSYINDIAADVLSKVAVASLEARLKPGEVSAWSVEGFELAFRAVYPAPPILVRGKKPSASYQAIALKESRPAVVLAGLRLASLLNRTLVPSPQSSTPPDER